MGRLFVRLHVDRPSDGQRIKRAWKIRKHTDTDSILSGQLELEWGGGGGDWGGALNLEELNSKNALEEKKEEKLSAKSARMEGRNHGNSKSLTKKWEEISRLKEIFYLDKTI